MKNTIWNAVYSGCEYVESLKTFLQKGADPNAEHPIFGPLLILAVIRNDRQLGQDRHDEIVELLLDYGADVNSRAPSRLHRDTALILASEYGDVQLVKIFLKHGADLMLKNDLGLTALDVAKKAKEHKVIELLEEALKKN